MNTCITHTHTHTHTHAHTRTHKLTHMDTIQLTKIYCVIIIRIDISQVMDSQVDSKTLNNLLEHDMISLSGGESDTDLLRPHLDTNSQEDMHTTTPFSTLDELLASPPIRNSTNTTPSSTSSTIAHPLYCMTITTTHSTISTTNPTLTLQYQPTVITLPTSTIPPPPHTSYNTLP